MGIRGGAGVKTIDHIASQNRELGNLLNELRGFCGSGLSREYLAGRVSGGLHILRGADLISPDEFGQAMNDLFAIEKGVQS